MRVVFDDGEYTTTLAIAAAAVTEPSEETPATTDDPAANPSDLAEVVPSPKTADIAPLYVWALALAMAAIAAVAAAGVATKRREEQ